MRLALAVSASLLLAACGQKIVVVECDGSHPDQDGAVSSTDDDSATGPSDGSAPNRDGSIEGTDGAKNPDGASATDGGLSPDGGPATDGGAVSCAQAPYCVHDLAPSVARANVRQAVAFTPRIDNPGNAALTFSADKAEVVVSRRAGLPPASVADLDLSVAVDQSGTLTFTVNDVPPWFATTTFTVKLHARASGGPDVVGTGSVEVRGNVLFSGASAVYAVASDGRPAHSVNFTSGELISGSSFIATPRSLCLARDGSLLVYDAGASPPRIRRFELTAENVGLGDFEYHDAMNVAYVPGDQTSHGLAQLMDGRIILPVYAFGRTGGDSFVLVFHEDGSFDRRHLALNPTIEWEAATASRTANEIVILEGSPGRLFRLDPNTGMELGTIASDFSGPHGVTAVPGGNFYVGIGGAVIRVTPQGGKTMVSMLPGDAFDYWGYLATYADGKIIAARDTISDYANIDVIDGTTSTGWLRAMNARGAQALPSGLVYLE
jgi:hypothetical protein